MPLLMPSGINGGGGNSSYKPGTPGNPTKVEAIAKVLVVINVLAHTTVVSNVVAVEQ